MGFPALAIPPVSGAIPRSESLMVGRSLLHDLNVITARFTPDLPVVPLVPVADAGPSHCKDRTIMLPGGMNLLRSSVAISPLLSGM